MTEYFKLEENKTNVRTEFVAGLTTFLAMSYIIFVNPAILSETGMPYQGVFIATCLSAAIATAAIGLIANVPYALASGMGLNAFFTYTVVFQLGFSWQEALAMVFICGLFNILITVTKFRQMIIHAIPSTLQHAISGGIGIFIAYIGLKNANIINFSMDAGSIMSVNGQAFDAGQEVFEGGIQSVMGNGGTLPAISSFTDPMTLVALFGIILMMAILMKNTQIAVLLGIGLTAVLALIVDPSPLLNFSWQDVSLGASFQEFTQVFGAAFSSEGLGSLLADPSRYPLILVTIFAFSLSDVFDTIGTFIGTGVRSGIFDLSDSQNVDQSSGFNSKMDRALFGDAIGTSIGAILGTSNTTTYVESAAGIGAGGRTGLTSIVTAFFFILSIFLAPVISLVPAVATAPALVAVGVMMMASFTELNWNDLEDAFPAFFASVFMGLAYSVSYGIAAGFLAYIVVKFAKGKLNEVHPIIWLTVILFVLNFIILAIL